MNVGPYQSLSTRQRRAVALGALALIATAAASVAYLRPQLPASDINPLVSTNAMSFTFVTPSTGWASLVHNESGWDVGQSMVFRTTDGAHHWQLVLIGQPVAGVGAISVQMFGKTRGFMTIRSSAEELYRTNDGGANWVSVGLSPSLGIADVVFSDPSHGWLESASTGGQSRLYSTRDGGNNWERLTDPPVDAFGLGFRRPTEAWLGSDGLGPPHVYISSDSGQSWQRDDLPAPAGRSWTSDGYCPSFLTRIQLAPGAGAIASVVAIRHVADSTSSGTMSCAPHSGNVEIFFFTSKDVGIAWKQVPSPPGIVAYQDSIHWWATNQDTLFKSTDAGQSWRQMATLPAASVYGTLGILDSTHAWVAVKNGDALAVTYDGGLHWTLANVPNPAISP